MEKSLENTKLIIHRWLPQAAIVTTVAAAAANRISSYTIYIYISSNIDKHLGKWKKNFRQDVLLLSAVRVVK